MKNTYVSRLDQLLTFVDIEERYLKNKKYSSDRQHMANQDWIKYRICPKGTEINIILSKNAKCSRDVQFHAVSRLLELSKTMRMSHEAWAFFFFFFFFFSLFFFAPCMFEGSAQFFHVQLVPCGVPRSRPRHAQRQRMPAQQLI